MSRRVLAPHKEQDGWCYIRVPNAAMRMVYQDVNPEDRVISSRRVEEAVEIADYLKLCHQNGYAAIMTIPGTWRVLNRTGKTCSAPSLREAYHRMRQA